MGDGLPKYRSDPHPTTVPGLPQPGVQLLQLGHQRHAEAGRAVVLMHHKPRSRLCCQLRLRLQPLRGCGPCAHAGLAERLGHRALGLRAIFPIVQVHELVGRGRRVPVSFKGGSFEPLSDRVPARLRDVQEPQGAAELGFRGRSERVAISGLRGRLQDRGGKRPHYVLSARTNLAASCAEGGGTHGTSPADRRTCFLI